MIYAKERNYLEECSDIDSFYDCYMKELMHHIEQLAYQEELEYDVCGEDAPFLRILNRCFKRIGFYLIIPDTELF